MLLQREGWTGNIKRTYRVYRDLGLQLRNKTPKRGVKAKLRDDRQTAVRPNEVWAMDFVHDKLATGKKIRVLTIVDTFTRYVPALEPRFRYRAEDVVRTLEQVCPVIGYPRTATLHLDPKIVQHFRHTGPGWHSRINTTLERCN